jgi:hypothetical protein
MNGNIAYILNKNKTTDLSKVVPTSRKINNKTLTEDISLTLTDLNIKDSASGYIDIGSVRIQWGSVVGGSSSPQTVTLIVPFKDTSYHFSLSVCNGSNVAYSYSVDNNTKTTTTCKITKSFANGSGIGSWTGEPFTFFAIGLKP